MMCRVGRETPLYMQIYIMSFVMDRQKWLDNGVKLPSLKQNNYQ